MPELSSASGQPPANAGTTAATLVRYGVLEVVGDSTEGRLALRANRDWDEALDEARRRSAAGELVSDQRILIVAPDTAHRFYELLADRERPDRRLIWMARVPDSPQVEVLVALDPEIDEDELARLLGELRQAEVAVTSLKLGRLASFATIRNFAAESLPGAFAGEGD